MNFKQRKQFLITISLITIFFISCTCFAAAEDDQEIPSTDGETVVEQEDPSGGEDTGDDQELPPEGEEPVEELPTRTVYVMKVHGKEIMTVKSIKQGKSILKSVAKSFVPKDSKMASYKYKQTVKFVKVVQTGVLAGSPLKTKDAAVKYLRKKMKSSDSPLTLTIVSNKYRTKKTPVRVKFKYRSDMFDFEFKIHKKGKKGTVRTRYEYKSRNGKIFSKKKKETKTIKKGKYTIIYTGRKHTPGKITYKRYKKYKADVDRATYRRYGDVLLGMSIVNYGKRFIGSPYRAGGSSFKTGIDCVAFVRRLYQKFGITLPGNRWKLFRTGKKVSYKNAKPGDIVFYGPHPAIYIGHGKIISARKSGVRISAIGYKKWTYIRRVR